MRFRGVLVIVCAWLGTAAADTPQQQADKLFAEGRELLTVQKDAKAACEKFEAAIKLDATATGTMLNLGLCYENLGRYATSIKWFRKAQAAASENKLTEYEEAAKTHTGTISPKVPTLKITVDGPPDTEIRIDGDRIDATTYGRVEVDPGTHEVVGRAAGKKRVIQTVDLKDAESQQITITVNEDAIPVYVDKGVGRRRGGLVLMGVGLAAYGFTGIYGIVKKREYEDPTNDDFQQARDDLRSIGTTVFIVGSGAIIAGAILYLTAPRREQISDGTAFAPVITNDQLGFAVSGSF